MHYNIEIFDDDLSELQKIERDLEKVKKYCKDLFKIYFSDFNTLVEFINETSIIKNYFNDIYLRINSKSELEKLKEYDILNNMNIIIELNDLNAYKNSNINNYNLLLQIDTVKELSPNRLKGIQKEFNINQIIVGQICYVSNYFEDFFKRIAKKFNIDLKDQLNIEKKALISNDNYTLEEYELIYQKLLELVNGININDSDINKFKKIYDVIIHEVSYDFDSIKSSKLFNQNLIGGLFYKLSVCEGYSKISQQALSLVDIESIVVGGGGKKEDGGHIWNQVKIEDEWYNADSAYDSIQVHNNEPIALCLVDDDELFYKTYYPIAKECNHKYDFDKLRK